MYNLATIRKLARSNKWQTLYGYSKEFGVSLFPNTELTKVQAIFLRWLSIYEFLEQELTTGKTHLTREIIEDDLRTDAYLFVRRLENNKKDDGKGKDKKQVDSNSSVPSVIFRRKSD